MESEETKKSWWRVIKKASFLEDNESYLHGTREQMEEYRRAEYMCTDVLGNPFVTIEFCHVDKPPIEYIEEQIRSLEPEIYLKQGLLNEWKEHLKALYPEYFAGS